MPEHKDLSGQRFGKLLVTDKYERINRRTYWTCQCDCGNIAVVRADGFSTRNNVSCGCYNKEHNQYKGSRLHPRYNDAASSENLRLRETPEGKEWRKQVYRLYNYTCVICSHKSSNLNAHHLYGFHSFPAMRYDISNGVCLCKSCHKEYHNWYGRIDNTKEQFNEYYKLRQELYGHGNEQTYAQLILDKLKG